MTRRRTADLAALVVVFATALALRLVYLFEVSHAPYFADPLGDAAIYHDRARQILAGHWIGSGIPFHSSPPYPYFIAMVLAVSRGSFLALGMVQAMIGSANCLLVYLLARRLAAGARLPALLAGLAAALYGLFAFFDLDLLMIFLTLFFTDLALLLLLRCRDSPHWGWPLLAGLALGVAALDKTNLLLCAAVAGWWLAADYSFRRRRWRLSPLLWFAFGLALMVLPVTARNYLVGHDLVLVSSNAGVNLFIGNNPRSQGVFYLPPDSGLSNVDLEGSSVRVAERAAGRTLRPSEVSAFWASQARRFAIQHPWAETRLLGRKLALLLNAYEIPNHLNFYFVRAKYAPVLHLMFVGFWLVVPVALLGVGWRLARGLTTADRLCVGFLASYAASLLPFFITERYRLPMVPILVALAAATAVDLGRLVCARARRPLLALGLGLAATVLLVNRPMAGEFDYTFVREIIAAEELAHVARDPAGHADELNDAILELKQALEEEPSELPALVNLGTAYLLAGWYTGAVEEWEQALRLDPSDAEVAGALGKARDRLRQEGDRVTRAEIPLSPFEQARALGAAGREGEAARRYAEIIAADPYNREAFFGLAEHHVTRGNLTMAARVLEHGLQKRPHDFLLLNNLGHVEFRMGRYGEARGKWEECLRLRPGDPVVLRELAMIPSRPR